MPGISKQTATDVFRAGPVEDRSTEVDGYTINIVSFAAEIDGGPLLRGLRDDMCQCPHWGYVVKGTFAVRYPGHVETFAAGDAFYAPPGHVPVHGADSELVLFSPTHELRVTEEAIKRNMAALQQA